MCIVGLEKYLICNLSVNFVIISGGLCTEQNFSGIEMFSGTKKKPKRNTVKFCRKMPNLS